MPLSKKNILGILIIVGGIPFVLGSIKLIEGIDPFQKIDNISELEESIPWGNTLTFRVPGYDDIHFKTNYIFTSTDGFGVGSNIFFEFVSTVDQENVVKEIIFIITDEEENFGERYPDTDTRINVAREQGRAIEIVGEEGKTEYKVTGNFSPIGAKTVMVHQLVFTHPYWSGNSGVFRADVGPIFEVTNVQDTLQSNANKAIVLQAAETKKSNSIVIGLTLIIISLVPFGILAEMVIRPYFPIEKK